MIASSNPKSSKREFENLLQQTLKQVNSLAKANKLDKAVLTGRDLEPFIETQMNIAAKGTDFAGTIKRWSGQRFPDIVAKKFFGVEVKSTTQDHWITTGNSVLESTRVGDVERIYMMFGKLAAPIEFRCRPYEECMSEVIVTHSPRYKIDMELAAGHTIFDKMKMSYDQLRVHEPPIVPILKYYRDLLKPGEQIWWLGETSLITRFWNSLRADEKENIRITGFVFYPEIFGNSPFKYNRLTTWLAQKRSIICPNVRDIYTASGQQTIKVNGETYKGVPQIVYKALTRLPAISERINNSHLSDLRTAWGANFAKGTVLDIWIRIVVREVKKSGTKLNIERLFNDYRDGSGL